jgi:hypothetical protein
METCNQKDCQNIKVCRGYCDKHYRRWKKHGDAEYITPPNKRNIRRLNGKECAIDNCVKVAHKKGWCYAHYGRWYRTGSVEMPPGKRPRVKGATAEVKANYIRNYKLQSGCEDCGYKIHHCALDFDHRPGTTKVRDIKKGSSFGWLELMDEIDKCDVVCANCHRVRTYTRVKESKVT